MSSLLRILIVAGLHHVVVQALRPLTTLYAAEAGANPLEVGVIAAAFGFSPLLLAVPAGRLADRRGPRLPVVWGSVGLALATALSGLLPAAKGKATLAVLVVAQGLSGIAQLYVIVALQAATAAIGEPRERDHHFGLFSFWVSLGGFVGPLIGGVLADRVGLRSTFLLFGLAGLAPAALGRGLAALALRGAAPDRGPMSAWRLLRLPGMPAAMSASMLVLFANDQLATYFPLYAADAGLTAGTIGFALALRSAAAMVVRLLLDPAIRRFGRPAVLAASLLSAGLPIAAVPLTRDAFALTALLALTGFGLGVGQPLGMAAVSLAVPPAERGMALGLRLAGNRLSQVLSPLFFGALGASLGLAPVFWASSAILAVGTLSARYLPEPDRAADAAVP